MVTGMMLIVVSSSSSSLSVLVMPTAAAAAAVVLESVTPRTAISNHKPYTVCQKISTT